MQTTLSNEFKNTPHGQQAGEILRACVHCGFCNAACPTYGLLGDELDGPRGRIYQMKQLWEGAAASGVMRRHLDRCLTCRACETACPSGVEYGQLLEISRTALDAKFPRTFAERMRRQLLARVIVNRKLFALLLRLGRRLRRWLPRALADGMPPSSHAPALQWPRGQVHGRTMLALAGCVQPLLAPNTNPAAAIVLDRLGITLREVDGAGCCGAVQLHTSDEARGRAAARALIDRFLPELEAGAEAVVMTASGCGVTLKDYARLFADDPRYRDKARRVSEKTVDLCELLARELPAGYVPRAGTRRVAFHAPCTLQHGQRITGAVEAVLARAGHTLCRVGDGHLCCGAAGTYALLQPGIAARLRGNKQATLAAARAEDGAAPEVICTANVGCQAHLAHGMDLPVMHWVELLV